MRVITGSARGMKLISPQGDDIRPTTDKVKESLFCAIHFEVPGSRVLDLFAGSGQLGIEALSRGASFCVFVDSHRGSLELAKQNLQKTGLYAKSRVVTMDYLDFLRTTKDTFDIAFLDPPYNQELIGAALPLLSEKMSGRGVIVCETGKQEQLPDFAGDFARAKEYNYGKIKLTMYRKEG